MTSLGLTHKTSIALIASIDPLCAVRSAINAGWKPLTRTTNPITNTNMERKAFILFAQTNPYQANRDSFFRGRTKVAAGIDYVTQDHANLLLMQDCLTESDNYTATEDGRIVRYLDDAPFPKYAVIMERGALAYEHDGKVWWYCDIEECDDEEIGIAIDCRVINENDLKGTKHEVKDAL
jgi:hypothetical protein